MKRCLSFVFIVGCHGTLSECEKLMAEVDPPTYCIEPSGKEVNVLVYVFDFHPMDFDQAMDDVQTGDVAFSIFQLSAEERDAHLAWYLHGYTVWNCMNDWAVDYGSIDYYMDPDNSEFISLYLPLGVDAAPEQFYCLGPSSDNDGTY